ncbi:MATE family efflux transporter [uncultured Rikenella sp.]|uniref:MATE family efflux transporter n=1 Tax=uncultured Rikenella sp. TaxID=368003 RepID=UPI00260C531C|nr:MATE family efflux transporter [uncultured Rikenella sp.]
MKDFTSGPVGRQILLFSLPIIMGNFVMQLYQIVDSAIVGRYLGKEALAAVGASTPVVFAVIALVIGVGSGASVVLSQYYGARQYDKVRLTSDTLHVFLVGSGLVVALVGIFFSEGIFRLIGLPQELIPLAADYLRIYLGGIFLLFGFNTVAAVLRGVGDSKTPLYFLLLSAILNVGLDLLFILVFGWGVAGAAWATVAAQGAAYFTAVWYINAGKSIFRIDLLKLRFDRTIFRQCINYGLPTGVQQAFVAFGMVALMGIVNGWGTDVIAGYSAAIRVDHLAVIPSMNFAMALTSFTGQNVGAGHLDRVHKGLKMTMIFSSLTCVAITAVIVLFGADILRIFTVDPDVIRVGTEYLVIVSLFYLIFSAMFVINGMLRGAGAVIFPMFSTLVSLWAVRIPAAMWLSRLMGEQGIWWSVPIGWSVGLAIAYGYYKSGKWENHSIFAKNKKKPESAL